MRKTLIWAAGIIAGILIMVALLSYVISHDNKRTVSVSGECITTVPKDYTAITFRVRTVDKNAAVSMKNASQKVASLMDYLKTQDVQVETTEFSSYEKTEWDNTTQKSVSLGTETNIAVEVSANKIETIEAILNKFAGAPDIYSENLRMFTSSQKMKAAMEGCLETAIKNARERANAIAKSEHRTVGKMISAEYAQIGNDGGPSPVIMMRKESVSMATDLSSKDAELTVNISAMFEIK